MEAGAGGGVGEERKETRLCVIQVFQERAGRQWVSDSLPVPQFPYLKKSTQICLGWGGKAWEGCRGAATVRACGGCLERPFASLLLSGFRVREGSF